ncbi:galactose-specific lectin nattectin-like [Diretmus argenteus]
MLFFLFFLGLALAAVPPSAAHEVQLSQGSCPMSWYSFNNRCYKYVAAKMIWIDAMLTCVSQKANLVSVHSPDENQFVSTLIKNFSPNQVRSWIGLSDLQKEGNWMWSDGSQVDFIQWDEGQPDNHDGEHL